MSVQSPSPSRRALQGLLGLTWAYRGPCFRLFVYQVVLLALGLGGVSLSGLAIDVLRHGLAAQGPAPRWPLGLEPPAHTAAGQLLVVATSVIVLGLAHAALSYVATFKTNEILHLEFVPRLRQRLFKHVLELGSSFQEEHGSSSLINRLTGDVQATRSFIDQVMLRGAVLILTLAVFAVYMLRTHALLAAACLLPMPVIAVLAMRFSAWALPAYACGRTLVDDLVRTLTEGTVGIIVTKALGREADELRRFGLKNERVRSQAEETNRSVSRFSAWLSFLPHLSTGVLLLYGGSLVSRGDLTLGELVSFGALLTQFASQVATLAQITNTLQQSVAGAARVFEVLEARPAVTSLPAALEPTEPRGHLRLEGVGFNYPGGQSVLTGVDLEVRPGKCVALLGLTGAGKSTLVKLVDRFYDVTQGQVLLDGVDVRELPLNVLRRSMACVFQETTLFRGSVRDNIAFGDPALPFDSVVEAARLSGAHEFIEKLPAGYQTELSEQGLDLSGGQRQRLALARALARRPALLVLDDPTAALDPLTEQEVLRGIAALAGRTSVLLVTGRLSTCRIAQEVYILERGRVVAHGSPEELLERPGFFQELARLQGWLGVEGGVVV